MRTWSLNMRTSRAVFVLRGRTRGAPPPEPALPLPHAGMHRLQKWIVRSSLPSLVVGFFSPIQESGNPEYEYPLVGLHRGTQVR